MTKDDFDVITVDHWECPAENGVPILTMPNIPRALHGNGLQPRTIYGKTVWDFMRKKCYLDADYKSEISGIEPPKGRLESHELFSYDYLKQEGIFQRCIALTKEEHAFIHSGRLITMYKEGNVFYPKHYVLKVVENGYKLIHDYNVAHPDQEPLRTYVTTLEYLDTDLHDDMVRLIQKYDIKFYREHIPKNKLWKGWHVIVGSKRYNSPYKSAQDWKDAMSEMNKNDSERAISNPFQGEAYDEWDRILKTDIESRIAGCGNGRLSKRGGKDGGQ